MWLMDSVSELPTACGVTRLVFGGNAEALSFAEIRRAFFSSAFLRVPLLLCVKTGFLGLRLPSREQISGLVHGASDLATPHTALAQVGLAALDARDELRIQFSLVFEVIRQPILKLHGLFGRQLPHLSFDGFELAHVDSVPCRIWNF